MGGRRYADPDILSLIRETGQLIDPRSTVVTRARRLSNEYIAYGGDSRDPIARLIIIASLCGLEVEAMDSQHAARYNRDAVLIPVGNHGKRVILYNPARPAGRIAFSIAHEIAHTFFPATGAGARFRTVCNPATREANELERLCDLAASELLMPIDRFRVVVGQRFGLPAVESTAAEFGSSMESTAFRMASAHPGVAVAGLLMFRRRKQEERAIRQIASQQLLFGAAPADFEIAEPKYRRQSFFASDACTQEHLIPWNKSFTPESVVYRAGRDRKIRSGAERLPNKSATIGRIEAMPAPFQRSMDVELPDVLFFWVA